MPYKIEKSGDHWIVKNKETGEKKGKSVSREKALAHMRAMYANEGIKKGLQK